jgi:hypothetical protein
VPQIMLKLWIFGLLVAFLLNFCLKNHCFLAERRYDVNRFSLFSSALAPGAIYDIICELLFTRF